MNEILELKKKHNCKDLTEKFISVNKTFINVWAFSNWLKA